MSQGNIIKGINPDRIKWALDEIHLDVGDFGQTIGIPKFAQKLADDNFTFNQLQTIANELGYGVLFFMEKGLPNLEVHSVHYRTLANQNINFDANLSKLVKQVEKHRDVYLSILEELEEPVTDFKPPELTGSMKDKAQAVRQWLDLDQRENYDFNTYKNLILSKGILVFQSAGYLGKWKVHNNAIDGFAIYYEKTPVIFVTRGSDEANIFKSKSRQSFTLFHELAHILLHKQDKIDNAQTIHNERDNKEEREANHFAGLCLAPDEIIKNTSIPDSVSEYQEQFKRLARKIGASVEVIVRRLWDENKITKQDYQEYIAWYSAQNFQPKKGKGSRKWRHREPIHIFGKPYVCAVLSGLAEKHITLNKASNYLDKISTPDIKELQKYL